VGRAAKEAKVERAAETAAEMAKAVKQVGQEAKAAVKVERAN
tara:strand:- start:479 stop:604 length:126 start_codon:yes stop_codon:yes gene_type:complete